MVGLHRHIQAQPRSAATVCSGAYSSSTAKFDAKYGVPGEIQTGACKYSGTKAPIRICTPSNGWAVICDKCTEGGNNMQWWHYVLIAVGALLLIMAVLGVVVAVVRAIQKRSAPQADTSVTTVAGTGLMPLGEHLFI